MNITQRYLATATAAAVAALLLGGCGSTHLATTTARDGIGPGATSPGSTVMTPIPSTTTSIPSTPIPSTPPTATGPAYEVTPADFAAMGRLMKTRAHAIVAGHEGAFIATLDRGRPAFVAAQRVVYENLQDLPLTTMSYDVSTYGVANAPGITGGPLASPPVVEHVYFAGTDKRAMATSVNSTFVKRSGHWLLAAESTDVGGGRGVTARPWDGPRIDVVVRGPLIVVADASAPGRAASVADSVENDIAFDAGILDVPVDDHLLVDATSSGAVSKFDNDESAGAVTFAVYASRNFQGTSLAGLRVKLNPQYISEILSDSVTLRHELTHFLLYQDVGVNPIWLTEGIAEYVSHQPAGLPSEYMTQEAYDRLMHRRHELVSSGLFGIDPETDYPLAMASVTYLVNHGGISKVEDLMAAYAVHRDEPYGDSYTGHLLHRIYGMSPADVAHGAFDLLSALR